MLKKTEKTEEQKREDKICWIAFVISLAMMFAIVIAKLIGCTLPLIAKKCKLDPAVMASPFITTIVDALSLFVYCKLALAFLM